MNIWDIINERKHALIETNSCNCVCELSAEDRGIRACRLERECLVTERRGGSGRGGGVEVAWGPVRAVRRHVNAHLPRAQARGERGAHRHWRADGECERPAALPPRDAQWDLAVHSRAFAIARAAPLQWPLASGICLRDVSHTLCSLFVKDSYISY